MEDRIVTSTDDTPVTIVDPSDRKWKVRLDSRPALGRLIPRIADHLFLPDELTYELIERDTQRRLDLHRSAAAQSVRADATIRLVPVRDQKFYQTIDRLRREADRLRRHNSSIEADARLALIRRLQSGYEEFELHTFASATSGGVVATAEAYSNAPRITLDEPSLEVIHPEPPGYTGTMIVVLLLVIAAAAWAIFGATGNSAPVTAEQGSGGEGDPVATQIAAATRTGDLQFTLTWDAAADLDLHVRDPFGDIVSTAVPIVRSGGRLLGEGNSVCLSEPGALRQETIVWDGAGAPAGEYQFWVVWASSCGAVAPVAFTVRGTAGSVDLGTTAAGEVVAQPGGTSTKFLVERQANP